MGKNKIIFLSIIFLVYFLITGLLKWGVVFFNLGYLFLLLGGALGIFLLDIDHFLYVFYTRPEEQLSIDSRKLLAEKKYKETVLFILDHADLRKELVLHSAIFAPILFLLAVFIVTSSGSIFGSGLVLGLFLRYILDTTDLYMKDKEFLKERLFWNFSKVDIKILKTFFGLLILAFVFSSALFLK